MKKLYFLMCVLALLFPVIVFADALFHEYVILPEFQGACSIAGADFDGDNDPDFVVTASGGGNVGWFENDGALNFTQHMITEDFGGARALDAAKIDSDDHFDIVATATSDSTISWFKNDGTGNFTEHVLVDDWYGASFVLARDHYLDMDIDIDGDGDTDIIATACSSNTIGWFENNGEGNFTSHILTQSWTRANGAAAADVDSDGDMDILATGWAGIVWFENDGEENFTQHTIFNEWDRPNSIQVADIDLDGDIDFAATSCGNSDAVGWFENDGQENFTMHLIKDGYNGARSMTISDIDEDGDIDFMAIAWVGSTASFFENDGSQNFTERVFCSTAFDLLKLFVIDLDMDGDLDILGSCFGANEVRWWENIDTFLLVDFKAEPMTGHAPLTTSFADLSYSKPATTSWEWHFDDDGIVDSYEQNPTWTFSEPGDYTVCLITTNSLESQICEKQAYISVFSDGESALNFDGQNGFVNCGHSESVNLTEAITIEAWINPTGWGESGVAGYGRIADKNKFRLSLLGEGGNFNDQCLNFQIFQQAGPPSFSFSPDSSITLGQWQHVAVTFSQESGVQMYINGISQEISQTAPPTSIADNTDYDLIIGNSTDNSFTFDGKIDEVRIWNGVRTQEEIQENMGQTLLQTTEDLVGYWPMNEGCGATIMDNSGNENNGTLNSIFWVQGTPFIPTSINNQFVMILPQNIVLRQNYPNPFNPETTIDFEIPVALQRAVKLQIYDISGKLIKKLVDEKMEPGYHSVVWNGQDDAGLDVASGVYFYRIEAGNYSKTKSMLLLK